MIILIPYINLLNLSWRIKCLFLIVLEFNDMSTLVGHFVSPPREREKRDRRDSRGDEREEQERKRNRNESEETEEIKTFPLYPYLLQGYQALPNCKPISVEEYGVFKGRFLLCFFFFLLFLYQFPHSYIQPNYFSNIFQTLECQRLACSVKSSTDDIMKYLSYFSQKIGFDISCKLRQCA